MEFEIQTDSADLVKIKEYVGTIQMLITDPDCGAIVTFMTPDQAKCVARELLAVARHIENQPS